VNGAPQTPFEGVSLAYSLNDRDARGRHITQYFEIGGNRAVYHDGWLARTIHKASWEPTPRASFEQDSWNLYDTRSDFSLARDVAAQQPARLKELQALFMQEALKYRVLPLDDRSVERLDPAIAGRPDLMGGRTSLTLFEGMTGMMENTFINVKGRSKTITADVEIPAAGASGVLLAQGGRFGGWALYLQDGKPTYTYNWVGLQRYTVAAGEPLGAGKATITVDFAYDGGGRGKGGTATLSVNGRKVAQGRVDQTNAFLFSTDEGADVGMDEDTAVAESYRAGVGSRFTGRIDRITVQVR
jgi:arylsulfatase